MVRGSPRNFREADPILDELVRQAFIFLQNNPTHLANKQPSQYYNRPNQNSDRLETNILEQDCDKELTEALKAADLLSEGYAAVLSGGQQGAGDAFESGLYRLVVYTIHGKEPWENRYINANLLIDLKKGDTPGIQNVVGQYKVDALKAVVFEEIPIVMEGWSGAFRQISISQRLNVDRDPDNYLFGAPPAGKSLIGDDGVPVKEYLFLAHQCTLDKLPPGTKFILDPQNDRRILVYTPGK